MEFVIQPVSLTLDTMLLPCRRLSLKGSRASHVLPFYLPAIARCRKRHLSSRSCLAHLVRHLACILHRSSHPGRFRRRRCGLRREGVKEAAYYRLGPRKKVSETHRSGQQEGSLVAAVAVVLAALSSRTRSGGGGSTSDQ